MQLVIKRFGQLTAKELYQILSLRAETFIVDQQIMYNDLDNVDQVSTHVFYQDTDSVAAYLRIIDAGQSYNFPLIGRVCVSNKGAGIGSKLLHDALDYLAQESSASKVFVESQLKAQPFYERAGFTQVSSKVLDHFDVLHHVLSLDLDAYRQTRNTVNVDDVHVSIRPLEVADLRALQKLSVETFVDTFIDSNTADDLASCIDSLYNTEKLARELAAKHSYFYFVEVEDQIAGYIKLNTRYEQTEGQRDDSLEIERLYILPRYKGLHLGSKLMKFALDLAKEKDKKRVWLGVWEHNEPAKAFYSRWGFKRFSQHTFQVGSDPQTDELWELLIQN